jgi:hypothetical protein
MANSVFESLYHEELYLLPAHTLIVLHKPWNEHSEEEKTLLEKILGSVKLGLPSVRIITVSNLNEAIIKTYTPSRIISFGVPADSVSGKYQHTELAGVSIICADALASLDDARKKNLWLALRQMFSL